MSNNAELADVLRGISELVNRDDVDTSWSSYEADELRSEIGSLMQCLVPLGDPFAHVSVSSSVTL